MFRNYKYLNEFGMISTLHTFGRDLKWNPHIHALVPELVYDNRKKYLKHINHFDYESLRKTSMYEVNRLLKERFPDDKQIKKMIDDSYKNGMKVSMSTPRPISLKTGIINTAKRSAVKTSKAVSII